MYVQYNRSTILDPEPSISALLNVQNHYFNHAIYLCSSDRRKCNYTATSFTFPAINDLLDVTDYLVELGDVDIYDLGLTLGLNQLHLQNLKASPTFRNEVIAAWLLKEDQVTERGAPTWMTLVKALRSRRLSKTGVADKIATEKNVAE